MSLNRIFVACLIALAAMSARAQYNNDNLTCRLYYNTTYGMWGVDIGLENEQTYCTLQGDISLDTSLFEFDEELYAFTNRAKSSSGLETYPTHGVVSHVWDSGFMRFLISSDRNTDIQGNSGPVIFFGLKVKDGATVDESREYPVNLTNILIVHNEIVDGIATVTKNYTQGIVNDSSFCCYDRDALRPAIYGSISQGELADFRNGVATSPWAVEANLTYCTMDYLGRVAPDPDVSTEAYNYNNRYNKNLLYYVNDRSLMATSDKNVIVVTENESGEKSYVSNAITLYDDGKQFFSSNNIVANSVSYNREFVGGYWSTVCLPFSLSEEQLAAMKQEVACELEELTAYEDGILKFTPVTEMKANRPYIIRTASAASPFLSIQGSSEILATVMDDISVGGVVMRGGFTHETIVPTDEKAIYGFGSTTGNFVKVLNSGMLNPFRAYIEMPVSMAAKAALFVSHDGTTGVSGSVADCADEPVNIYTLDGKLVRSSAKRNDAAGLKKGVYISGDKKIVVK